VLETLPNREQAIQTSVRLRTPYHGACPVSGEPRKGSYIEVQYTPAACILGLDSVARHLPTYADQARDVETITQLLARDCAVALGVPVIISAHYKLRDGIELWATCQS
jgi:NADPH-dependent 7-cyano-7-deazaguanine reductase QueF